MLDCIADIDICYYIRTTYAYIQIGIWDCDVSNCCWENLFGFSQQLLHALCTCIHMCVHVIVES